MSRKLRYHPAADFTAWLLLLAAMPGCQSGRVRFVQTSEDGHVLVFRRTPRFSQIP